MKTFKSFIKNKNIPIIPNPIHFKYVNVINGLNEDFSKTVDDTDKYNGNIQHWYDNYDNSHLTHDYHDYHKKHSHLITRDDHDSFISEKMNAHVKHLKDDHQISGRIFKYTTGSSDINRSLIDDHLAVSFYDHQSKSDLYHNDLYHKDLLDTLDSAIKNNPLPHDLHVYSGVTFDPRNHVNSDGLMHSPAYISATHSKSVANSFAVMRKKANNGTKHIIHFHLKKDDPALHIASMSDYPREMETIIARNQKLKYNHTQKISSAGNNISEGNSGDYYIHHMEIHK